MKNGPSFCKTLLICHRLISTILWIFCSKANYRKIEENRKGLRIVFTGPHVSQEELLNRDQGIISRKMFFILYSIN